LLKSQLELKQELARSKKENVQLTSDLNSVKDLKDSAIASKEKLHEEAERKSKTLEVIDFISIKCCGSRGLW
jgi:hypothetical protein